MKKILIFALIAILCILLGGSLASAEETAKLQLSTDVAAGYGGDTITLSLHLTAENLGGLQTSIQWNEGYLTYIDGSAAFSDEFVQNADLNMINDASAGSIRLVYGSTSGYTAEDEAVFTAQFLLSEGVSGYTDFTFADTKLTDAAAQLNSISFETIEASVQTQIYNAGSVNLALSGDNHTPYIGDTVTVSMNVQPSGANVGSLQGTVSYDPNVFEYVDGSAAFSEEGIAAAFTQIINADTAGSLKFVYGSLTGCPAGMLLTMQFRVVNIPDNYSYICLTDTKATNTDTDHLSLMNCYTSDTYFNVQKRPEVLYYTTKIDETNVLNGDTLTLNITAEGVTMGGLQATLSYNAEQLAYVSGSASFTDAFAQGASISMINDNSAGEIKLIYSNANGYTPDGSAIFTAQFVVQKCGLDFDPITLGGIKTTNASAENLEEMESVFLQGIDWNSVLLGHDLIIEDGFAATCTQDGLTDGQQCSICEEVLTPQEVIPALGHTVSMVQDICESTAGDELIVKIAFPCGHAADVDVLFSSADSGKVEFIQISAEETTDDCAAAVFAVKAAGTATVTAQFPNETIEALTCTVIAHSPLQMTLPAGLHTIEDEAFMNSPVQELILPEGTEHIGQHVFAGCTALAIIHMPDSVTSIAENAFEDCKDVSFICPSENAASAFAARHSIPCIIMQ